MPRVTVRMEERWPDFEHTEVQSGGVEVSDGTLARWEEAIDLYRAAQREMGAAYDREHPLRDYLPPPPRHDTHQAIEHAGPGAGAQVDTLLKKMGAKVPPP